MVSAYAPLGELPAVTVRVAEHLRRRRSATGSSWPTWSPGAAGCATDADVQSEQIRRAARGWSTSAGRCTALDITVTSGGTSPEHRRTQSLHVPADACRRVRRGAALPQSAPDARQAAGASGGCPTSGCERLRSVEDVYLFRGVAHDNPKDVRLFAHRRGPRPHAGRATRPGGSSALPLLERMGLQALAAMRDAMAALPAGQRPQVEPHRALRPAAAGRCRRRPWRELAGPLPAARRAASGWTRSCCGCGCPTRRAAAGRRPRVQRPSAAAASRMRELRRPEEARSGRSPSTSRRCCARRGVGAPYPYEIVRMLTPPAGGPGDFPPGPFVEYDLDAAGELVAGRPPVRPEHRQPGRRADHQRTPRGARGDDAGSRSSATRPGGWARWPSRSAGGSSRPLDLAERLGVPVEWFALSSGARIAMDSGTENMDWIGAVLRRIIEFTQAGGEINVVVTGDQRRRPAVLERRGHDADAHAGILVMTPASAMVLTGKQALDFSGGVSAEDNFGIGGFERVMGPNGQAQYWAPDLRGRVPDPAAPLRAHLRRAGRAVPAAGTPRPTRPTATSAPRRTPPVAGSEFTTVGDVFSAEQNPERKKPFDIRSVMRAVTDADCRAAGAVGVAGARRRSAVVWDARDRRHPGVPARAGVAHAAPARLRAGRRAAELDVRHAVPAVLAQGGAGDQRGQRQPAAGRAGEPVRLRRVAGVDAALAAGVRRGDRPGGHQLRRADRLRRRLPLPRRRVRGLLQAAQRQHGDRRGGGLLRLGHRRRAGRGGGVRPRRGRAHRADPRVAELRERVAGGRGRALRAAAAPRSRAAVRAEKLGAGGRASSTRIHNIERALAVGSVDRIIAARGAAALRGRRAGARPCARFERAAGLTGRRAAASGWHRRRDRCRQRPPYQRARSAAASESWEPPGGGGRAAAPRRR